MPAQIAVWIADLARLSDRLPQLERHLDPAERGRAQRLRRAEDRARFVATRGLLRELLAEHLGVLPAAVSLGTTPTGKPTVGPDGLDFNVSHSGERAVIALARERAVGVDVERIRRGRDLEPLVRHTLAPAEFEGWRHLPDDQRAEAFTQAWARKEAYAKGRGEGLRLDPRRIVCEPGDGQLAEVRELDADAPTWTVRDLEVGEAYRAAVAAEGGDWEPRVEQV